MRTKIKITLETPDGDQVTTVTADAPRCPFAS